MTTGPSIPEILDAVGRWIDDGAPGARSFHGKVAVNALAIASREVAQWPAAAARATERLTAIVGTLGDFEELEHSLCTKLREGTIDPRDPRVLEHLRATTLDRLAIDQPSYRSLLR